MKKVQTVASATPTDALFDELPQNSKFPDPIWVNGGYGKIENGRLIIGAKITSELKQYVKDGLISFTILKKKQKDDFDRTHSLLINQDEWCKNHQINRNFLTLGEVKNQNAISFTITVDQLKSLAYNYTPRQTNVPGQYIKLEVVDNGMQVGIFRYTKETCKEAQGFKASQRMTVAPTPTINSANAMSEGEKAVEDFFKSL